MTRSPKTLGIVATLLLSIYTVAGAQIPACRALISANNDLFLTSASGNVLTQFTADGEPKVSAGIAPDGKKVVYIPSEETHTFTVVSSDGQGVTVNVPQPLGPSNATFEGIEWSSNTVVATVNHVSPSETGFGFYPISFPDRARPNSVREMRYGQACSLWGEGLTKVACIDANHITNGVLSPGSDSTLYYTVDVFAKSDVTQLTSFPIALGMSVTTLTDPAFAVRLVSL